MANDRKFGRGQGQTFTRGQRAGKARTWSWSWSVTTQSLDRTKDEETAITLDHWQDLLNQGLLSLDMIQI